MTWHGFGIGVDWTSTDKKDFEQEWRGMVLLPEEEEDLLLLKGDDLLLLEEEDLLLPKREDSLLL